MDFRLLGPLEVRSRNRVLALGGPKQRAILALLLLNAGEVVSTDRLVDELWGEHPPKTVDAYVQNCISRLRNVLGRDLIETRSPGYVLQVDRSSIDAVRFEAALDAARPLEPSERAAALREVLGLWRGAPLADLAFESFAQGEIARLEELRLVALEERLDAELELGRHTEVLAELTALANRHPTRERLRYLQMLGLYRSGRQREALGAYQEARRELVEELGLEPGEELRSLERMIIAHDPALGVEAGEAHEPDRRRVAVLAVESVGDGTLDGFDEIVERHGGTPREVLSDEAIAVFAGHDDDVLRALRAAFAVRERLPDARTVVDRVSMADVEAVRNLLYTADAENVVLGASALALVPAAVDVVPHGVGDFRVLRFDPRAEPFARHFDVPFVGRATELDRLGEAFAEVVATGSTLRVVVIGDAGVGKTRLVREFVRRSRGRAHALVGRCVGYGEGAAMLPVFQIIRRVGSLEAALAGEDDVERVAERLRDPAGFELSEGLWAFRRLLETLGRRLPIVLVFEDIHLAAGSLLDLVDYVDGWTAAPVLVLCIGRLELLERRPEWRDAASLLEPLPVDDVLTLAASLPERVGLDGDALGRAVEAAEGNPLFLEQYLAADARLDVPPTVEALIASRLDALPAVERAALDRAAVLGRDFWRAAVEDATPPAERPKVGGALMALARRRLVRPVRSVLEGEDGFRFQHQLIRDVAYAAIPPTVRAGLHESVARSLDDRHTALDEVVGYQLEQAALLRDDRALALEAGHRLGAAGLRALRRVDTAAAIDLLTRSTDLLGKDSPLELEWGLATGIKFSGDWTAAVARLDEVAARAASRGDRVIELRARVEQLLPKLSQGWLAPETALVMLDEARAVFETAGDAYGLGRAWHLSAAVLGGFQLRCAEGERAAISAYECYLSTGAAVGGMVPLLAFGPALGPTPAPAAAERCRQLLGEAETPVWTSFVLPLLALVEAMVGRFEAARRQLEEARVGRAQFADRGTLVTSWSCLAAQVELLAGGTARAADILSAAVESLRPGEDATWLAMNSAWLGEAQYRQGRFDAALRSGELALSVTPPDYLSARSVAGRVSAKALARAGRLDDARALAAETTDLVAATDALDERGEVAAATAEVLALSGDAAGAARLAAEAIELFEQKGNTVSAARVRRESAHWGKPAKRAPPRPPISSGEDTTSSA